MALSLRHMGQVRAPPSLIYSPPTSIYIDTWYLLLQEALPYPGQAPTPTCQASPWPGPDPRPTQLLTQTPHKQVDLRASKTTAPPDCLLPSPWNGPHTSCPTHPCSFPQGHMICGDWVCLLHALLQLEAGGLQPTTPPLDFVSKYFLQVDTTTAGPGVLCHAAGRLRTGSPVTGVWKSPQCSWEGTRPPTHHLLSHHPQTLPQSCLITHTPTDPPRRPPSCAGPSALPPQA